MNKKKRNILLILTISVFMIVFSAGSAFAVTVQNASAQVNSKDGVILRSSSSTSSKKLGTYTNNKSLTVKKVVFKSKTSTSSKNRWYYVSVGGKTGYIRGDLVDNFSYNPVSATLTAATNYRVGPGTKMKKVGRFKKGKEISVVLKAVPVSSTKGSSSTWYKFKYGKNYYYIASSTVKLKTSSNKFADMSDKQFTDYLTKQGFPSTYRSKLLTLHKQHPNWEFVAKKIDLKWATATSRQADSKKKYSLIYKSGYWVVATQKEVAYYMDPRHFLTEDYIFMFETLSYESSYQKTDLVDAILKDTYLSKYGFKSSYFISAGKTYDVSPVHLASRARLETGGANSPAINGTKYNGKIVYNPYNIGANISVSDGLKYAYNNGWFTKEKAVKEGGKIIAQQYVNKGQNTVYLQKFNFSGGYPSHQYMQNICAPKNEGNITYNSYKKEGKTNTAFKFIIPYYNSMPSSTSL